MSSKIVPPVDDPLSNKLWSEFWLEDACLKAFSVRNTDYGHGVSSWRPCYNFQGRLNVESQ